MDKKLKVAVVGVGHLGQQHARIYHQIPEVQLIAVVDTDAKRAGEIANRFTTKAVSDYRDLLKEVDAVSIASPTATHFEMARSFLLAGIHVLVEKPMTPDLATAKELVAIARTNHCKLQVGHTERFNPIVREIASRDLQPVYIEAIRQSPFRFRSGDIGVVLDLMIHDIDIIRWLAKSRIEKVEAVGGNVLGNLEDLANARLTFENGCTATITANRAAATAIRQIRIFTLDSYVFLDYAAMEGKIYRKRSGFEMPNLQKAVPPEFSGLSFEEMFYGKILEVEELTAEKREPLDAELNGFVKCILEDTPSQVSGEDGLRAMEIAQRVTEDLQRNLTRWKERFARKA